ncbi:MAG: recombinase family protein [Clostridiales bacterium]|nr:recombinase family protein [Clostridiales bacterium]
MRQNRKRYRAGIYCRISVEEREKVGEYSNSICSQIQMARDYIAGKKDITEEELYVDEGASGGNFERAEFRRMLADMELGRINMVILKDLSRLGRAHMDTAYYLGKYFPVRQIRVVALLDGYDSLWGIYDELSEIKLLLNDMYLREISLKIKASIRAKRRMGEYTQKEPPFGYKKSKEIHNHIEPDAYAAEIVCRIYRMYLDGYGCTKIARILNEENVLAPAKYKQEVLKIGCAQKTGRGLWLASSVREILKNPIYMGAIAIRKREKELVPNAHEPIISEEEFYRAQKRREENRISYFDSKGKPQGRRIPYPAPHKYVGLLFCGKCKAVMRKRYRSTLRDYDGYVCGFHQKMGKHCCEQNYIAFEKLDELLVFVLNQQMRKRREESEQLMLEITRAKQKQKSKQAFGLLSLERKIVRNGQEKKKAYEQLLDGLLSREAYLETKQRCQKEEEQAQRELSVRREEEQKRQKRKEKVMQWMEDLCRGSITAEQLEGDFLTALLDKVYVYPNHKIEVYFTFERGEFLCR